MPGLADHADKHRVGNMTVFERNWMALDVFLASVSQWRYYPGGHIQSLDYAAVHSVMQMLGIPQKKWSDTFYRVRAIEAGALEAIRNAKAK